MNGGKSSMKKWNEPMTGRGKCPLREDATRTAKDHLAFTSSERAMELDRSHLDLMGEN